MIPRRILTDGGLAALHLITPFFQTCDPPNRWDTGRHTQLLPPDLLQKGALCYGAKVPKYSIVAALSVLGEVCGCQGHIERMQAVTPFAQGNTYGSRKRQVNR